MLQKCLDLLEATILLDHKKILERIMDSKLPPGSPKIDVCILDLSGKEKGSRREEKEDTWVLQNCSFSLL
jgi:hypothetical protein